MLAGLEPVDGGAIRIGDRDVTNLAPKDRDIAMVFQNYALYPHMTVAENMGFARGKIDRIDRHPDGRVRVLDYKTSDSPVNPLEAHLDAISKSQPPPPPWACVVVNGKERTWSDLQLPLYRLALAVEFGSAVTCGYFNLPKAAGETAVSFWEDYTPELQVSAESCAQEIAKRVAAGEFWPPKELPERYDEDWATLFHHGAADSVAADWFSGGAVS